MQYSIPKCPSHIPNPLETVPSVPVTIEGLELNDSSKFHRAEWLDVISSWPPERQIQMHERFE